jgi:hypothetical protein|tara:strand:- start:1185 stop:1547 length:363 start_codon:yes stop_codon:yes gene_type:complete
MHLTLEENRYVLELYDITDNGLSRAVELYEEKFGKSVSSNTIRRKWKNAGYKPNPSGGQNNGLTDRQFRELHGKHEGDVVRMMEELGRENHRSLVRRCNGLSLRYNNIPKIRKRKSDYFF